MVDETKLRNRVREILSTSDLDTTTAGAVRRQLESDFAVDLSHRKKFISKLIDGIIQANHRDEDEAVADDNDQDEEVAGDNDQDEAVADDNDQDEAVADEDEEEDKAVADDEATTTPSKKRKPSGFMKVCSLSPKLSDFLGVPEMARPEVVKKLWGYIRDKNLQDPNNRRNIKCDDKLHSIFRVNTINMFQMTKVLSKHIWPLESECEVSSLPRPQKKQKPLKEDHHSDVDKPNPKSKPKSKTKPKPKPKPKQHTPGTSGLLKPLQLSEAFVNFLGTGETTLSRAEAVKRIWGYIKQNDLQDPSDKRRILCDEKLKELFEVDTFNGLSVSKYLTAHLSKGSNEVRCRTGHLQF